MDRLAKSVEGQQAGSTASCLMSLQTSIGELAAVAEHLSGVANRLGVTWPPETQKPQAPGTVQTDTSLLDRMRWQEQRLTHLVSELKTIATALDAAL